MHSFYSLLIAMVCLVMAIPARAAEDIINPAANPEAIVSCGNARFTVLTPELIRMEWAPDGLWNDAKTLTFVNRNLEVPSFKKTVSAKGVKINTGALQLNYRNDGQPFNEKNLSISFKLNGKTQTWHPGMTDTLNLKGTTRTLDGADGYKFKKNRKMEDGLLSRSGWALVDDSANQLFVPTDSHWQEWVAARPENDAQDLYFFGYGHNYKKALADYQKVAGRAMLPPLYTLGYWWSRYWQYSDNELVDLVDKFRSYDIPMDVLIVDMDWHDTYGLKRNNPQKDEFGQRVGWTGYSWQKQLFPNPANFLKWVKRSNLKTALNLHPASGIQPQEDCYEAFTEEYGWNEKDKAVPFHIDEEKWADAYFNTVLSPMEDMGVDFWWLDWQQWLESKFTKGLSNTFWLNHTFFEHAKERAGENASGLPARPFIYHRWGGLGSHRYPLGFSGDTYATWNTLAFLPWFTATSSNVNYGYWGHDIGGHLFYDYMKDTDPELYLRWLQYGVFTPIFKTHSTKDNRIIRYPWAFPEHQFMLRDAIKLRYALVPYIYNAARENYDTGVAMVRPMYYEYPEDDKAYNVPEQFFFGNDIIATAIAQPVDSVSGLAQRTIWLPEGRWYDFSTGNLYEGNQDYMLSYTLTENPFFVREGAIIPMNPASVNSLQVPCDTLVFTFIPGADGKLVHYEDDGATDDYKNNFATTTVSKAKTDKGLSIKIEARKGSFYGAKDARSYELRFPATLPPSKVIVDGKEYPYSRFPEVGTWTYLGRQLQPVVYTTPLSVNKDVTVELECPDGVAYDESLYGKQQIFNRCLELTPEFKEEQCNNGESMIMLPEGYLKVSQCPNFILEDPANIALYISEFEKAYAELPQILSDWEFIGPKFRQRVSAQLKLAE